MQSSSNSQGDSKDLDKPDSLIDAWIINEKNFEKNLYDGEETATNVIHIPPSEIPDCYIVAGHSVNHFREGEVKFADRGTGGLAILLAEITGCGALISSHSKNSDSNFDAQHPIKEFIILQKPKCVIDIHGMKSFENSPDLDIGLGTGLVPDAFINALVTQPNLTISKNALFDGTRLNTVTRFSQELMILTCQLEISDRCRPPLGEDMQMQATLNALINSISSLKRDC